LFASSIVAPDPNDDDDDAASTATTTVARGLLPPGLGVTLSLRHFALLLVVIDVVVVVSPTCERCRIGVVVIPRHQRRRQRGRLVRCHQDVFSG